MGNLKKLIKTAAQLQRLAIPLAALGLLLFILIATAFPFKERLLSVLFPKSYSLAAGPNDWAQVQKDPQRSGYSAETLGTNWKVKWRYAFQPERVAPQTQAIVYSNAVYIGTETGNLYAIDATTGAKRWSFAASGPILNSVAADNGRVYFGAMDGAVYAINTTNGAQLWKTQVSSRLGISTAPALADNKLMIGGRDGYFYGLDLNSGNQLWKYNAGSPILMTAAWDSGKAYFGTMDMHVHGVNSNNGIGAWKSNKIGGMAFKDYWPVVTQNKVIVTPWNDHFRSGIRPGTPFGWFSTGIVPGTNLTFPQWLAQNSATVAAGNAASIPEFTSVQDNALAGYAANPGGSTPSLVVLDGSTGQKAFDVPNFDTQAMHGAPTPPCLDKNGRLVAPVQFIKSGWGRIDLTTKRYVDILYDGKNYNGQPLTFSGNETVAGMGNQDENLSITCSNNLILGFHKDEINANYTGYFNETTRQWTVVGSGWQNGQMYNVNEAGGASSPSISGGMVYHISVHELIARTTL